jgi:hypothetical protein
VPAVLLRGYSITIITFIISVPRLSGRAMAQAVTRRPLIVEDRVRSQVNPCRICGGQSVNGTGFFPEFFGFPLSVLFHHRSPTHIIWGMKSMSVSGSSSETWSHPIEINQSIHPWLKTQHMHDHSTGIIKYYRKFIKYPKLGVELRAKVPGPPN